MQVIKSLTASQPALAVISRDRVRLRAEPSDIMVLDYLIRFVNADGTNVEGFAPGYTIGFERDHWGGAIWAKAYLPDGTEVHFIPRLDDVHGKNYVLDVASGYTLSMEPAAD